MSGLPSPVLDALKFEKANWAKGSVLDDPFYKCPADFAQASPGTLLKVEKDVDTGPYLIPAGTALSRILYQSEKLDGSLVPVSGFILWPYTARSQPDGYPVVAWAHGTSGSDADTAPSNHKNLWQHFLAPYQLALQGYVVVATDYAGLGVEKHASGEPITHEYLASPSQGNDVIHSVKAAQAAFPELSKRFVVIGHSQGGGAAWAVAQREATSPVPGYLGAIAISPYTSFLNEEGKFSPLMGAAICRGIASSFPEFDPKEILTQEGEGRVAMMFQTHAGVAAAIALLSGADLLKPDWKQNRHLQKHGKLTSNGGKPIKGPLLVIHGESDRMNSPAAVKIAVEKTASLFPSSQLEVIWLPHVTHAPALGASQRLWMDWIADRFAGVEVKPGCQTSQLASARPAMAYHKEQNWYLEAASQFYHTP
ncbi:hypothetical protein OEA41_008601 [Lepraria neglecta]|uniref:Serine aminopeptidase S33 domain-containing protein n=1 Tax=Lepraria neglecta TaxID=209136 RepID=A0AAD9Z2B6_9LECA|nr:hypothetical protein OEA41_008601 [Lepraria neglecta]